MPSSRAEIESPVLSLPAGAPPLAPLLVTLPAGSRLFRVYPSFLEATDFNLGHGAGARFHFLSGADGAPVPSLYAAETQDAALAESIFHDVSLRPQALRILPLRKVAGRMLGALGTRRDLELVQLHDVALERLGLEPSELTSSPPSTYPRTRAWGQALHDAGAAAGLVWMSRQFNSAKACTFFGDRVFSGDFERVGPALPLDRRPGLDLVYALAERAGVVVVHAG